MTRLARQFIRAGSVATLGTVAMLATLSTHAQDKKADAPTTKEIMLKAHTRGEGYVDLIRAATKAEKWDDAQKHAKSLALLGEQLGKNKAARGSAESWKLLCAKYADATKTAAKGADDKDPKLVAKGLGAMACGDCHKLHK